MLRERLIVILWIIPPMALLFYLGGWYLTIAWGLILSLAAREFADVFAHGGYRPSRGLLVGFVFFLTLWRGAFGVSYSDVWLGLIVIVTLGWFVFAYERGDERSASNFAITTAGILYLGWLGPYLISLRAMQPDGLWWLMTVFPSIWVADGFAYLIGRKIGRHKMAPRVSPNKSWEGYFAGVLFGALTGLLAGVLFNLVSPALTPLRGLILGLVVSLLAPIGDFGESLLKRQFSVKDSSNLLPGHGGVLDRIDATLWTGAIGFYIITYIFMI